MPDWSKLPTGFHQDTGPPIAPFEVTIQPERTHYSLKKYSGNHQWEGFPIQFAVINRSASVQVVGYWTCSYHNNWETDNAEVSLIRRNCYHNAVGELRILPDEGFRGDLRIRVAPRVVGRRITFRLAFMPYLDAYRPGVSQRVKGQYWSNPISLEIVK